MGWPRSEPLCCGTPSGPGLRVPHWEPAGGADLVGRGPTAGRQALVCLPEKQAGCLSTTPLPVSLPHLTGSAWGHLPNKVLELEALLEGLLLGKTKLKHRVESLLLVYLHSVYSSTCTHTCVHVHVCGHTHPHACMHVCISPESGRICKTKVGAHLCQGGSYRTMAGCGPPLP